MVRQVILALALLGVLAGCARVAESRFNPFNWFGRSESTAPLVQASTTQQDQRPLMDQITGLQIDPNPSGGILRARGLPPRQGWFNASLVPLNRGEPEDGVLSFEMRAQPPFDPTLVSTPQSREIVVAFFLTDQSLVGVREIRVTGARNARAVRR